MGSRRKNSSAVEILFCRISTSLPPALIRPFQFVLCPYFFCSSDLKKADLAANTCPHLGGVNQGGGFQSPHRAFFIHHIAAWLRALCSRHELWFTGEFSCVTDFEMRSFSDCSLFLLLTRYCHGGGTCRSLRRKEDRRTSTNVYCRRLNERHRRTSYGFYFCLSCAADPAKFDARTTSYVTNDVTLFQSDFVRKRTAEKKNVTDDVEDKSTPVCRCHHNYNHNHPRAETDSVQRSYALLRVIHSNITKLQPSRERVAILFFLKETFSLFLLAKGR